MRHVGRATRGRDNHERPRAEQGERDRVLRPDVNQCRAADAIERYVGAEYIQHNPGAGGGLSADTATVEESFDDIAALALRCKFTDCGHDTEPGCAVRAAVADGSLAAQRLDSWQRLRGEVTEQAHREQTQARRRRR